MNWAMTVDKGRRGHEDKSTVINAACWIPCMTVAGQWKRILEQINTFVCWSFVVQRFVFPPLHLQGCKV